MSVCNLYYIFFAIIHTNILAFDKLVIYNASMDDLPKKLQNFVEQYPLLNYKKGQIIFRADENPQGLYCIKEGYIRAYKTTESGEELTLMTFKPYEFFPTSWAINNRWNMYYSEAITDVKLWRVSKEKFVEFIKENPEILFSLTQSILSRLGGLLLRMQHLNLGGSYSRVASIIKIYSERFGSKNKNGQIVINVPLSHRDISTLIGLTRETVSVAMSQLKKKGIVDYKKQIITILDIKGLQNASHPNLIS